MLQLIDDQTASNYYNEIDTATGDDLQSKTVALEAWANNKKAVQARQEWDHVSKVFTDFDNYSAAEGLDAFDEESRYQYANRKFIANQTGDTPENQMFVYPSKRDEVTDQMFGKTGLSEKEAFDLFKGSIESRNASEEALRELPGVLAQGVLKRAGEGKPFDEVDSWFAFSDWKDRHADKLASMPKGWETAMLDSAVKLHARTEQLMDDVAPESKRAMDTLMKFTRPEDAANLPEADRADVENLAKDFAKLTPEKREGIYATLSYAAEAGGAGMGKGFWEKVGEGMARGGGNIYDDAAMTAQDRQARQNISFFQDLIDKPQAEPDTMQTADSIQMQRDMAQKGLEENKQRLGELRVMREIRDLAQGRIDPIKTEMDGVLGQVVQGAYDFSQSAAYTGMAMVPYVGLPAVMGALANSNYLRMLDQYPDMDADAAFDLSLAIAGPQALAERFQAGLLLGKLPFLGKAMKKLTDARVPLPARIGLGYGAVVGLETGTELVQEAMPIVADQLASAVREDMPEFDAGKAWGAYREQAPKIFYSMLWGGLMGGGAVGIRELERSGVYMRNLQELEMHGITGEAAQNIAAEQDADQATTLYREAWDKRSPEDIQAGIAKRAAMLDAAQATQANPDFPTRRIEENPDGTLTHIIEQNGQAIYSTNDPAAADLALVNFTSMVDRGRITGTTNGIVEALSFFNQVNEAAKRGDDIQKFILENTPRNLLDEYEANPTEQNLDNLFKTVATIGQDISEPAELANFPVLASNQGALAEGIFKSVIRIYEGATGDKVVRDVAQDNLKRAIAEGRIKMEWVRENLNQIIPQIESNRISQKLRTETDTDVIESFSDVALAYMRGNIRDEQIPAGLRGFLRRMAIVVKDIFRRAYKLKRLVAEGKVDANFESFLADSVGLNQQARVDTASSRVANELTQGLFNYSIGSMPEDQRTAETSGQPSPGGRVAEVIPNPPYSHHRVSDIVQTLDLARPRNEANRKYLKNEYARGLRSEGIEFIDAYHVSGANPDDLKSGINGSSVDYVGGNGNLRESSVYFFLDPDDIKQGFDGILGTTGTTATVVHLKIPVSKLPEMFWDGNFSITFEAYSAARITGDIPKKWIAGFYKYNHKASPDSPAPSTGATNYSIGSMPEDQRAAETSGQPSRGGSGAEAWAIENGWPLFPVLPNETGMERNARIQEYSYSILPKDDRSQGVLQNALINLSEASQQNADNKWAIQNFKNAKRDLDAISIRLGTKKDKGGFRLLEKNTQTPYGSRYYNFDYKGQWWSVRVADHANTADRQGFDDFSLSRARSASGMQFPHRLNIVLDQKSTSDKNSLALAKQAVATALEKYNLTNEDAGTYNWLTASLNGESLEFKNDFDLDELLTTQKESQSRAENSPDMLSSGQDRLASSETGETNPTPLARPVNPNSPAPSPGATNYSIASQSEIDRVNRALGGMNRGPDERLKVYERAREKFSLLQAWNRDELQAMQETGADDTTIRRSQILQGLGELDAILSILPPEVRGRVGGYTKLASIAPHDVFKDGVKVSEVSGMNGAIISAWMREGQNIGQAGKQVSLPPGYEAKENLATARADKAIADFFRDRIKRIDTELEKVLVREYTEAITKAVKQSRPKAGDNGVRKSTLGAETQKFADMVQRATLLDDEATPKRMAEIEAALTNPDATAEDVSALSEEWSILNTFGDLDNRSSETLAQGLDWLKGQLQMGREAWRIKEQARIDEQRARNAATIEWLGKGTAKKRFADKGLMQRIAEVGNNYLLDHASFEQFVTAMLPPEIAANFSERLRKGDMAAQAAEIRDGKGILDAVRTGAKAANMSAGDAMIWLKADQKNAVAYLEGRKVKDERIAIELAQKIVTGEADRSKLTDADVETLRNELAALPADTQKEFVTIKRVIFRGEDVKLDMSRAKAMQLLLSWNQPDVQNKMRKEGWTDESAADLNALVNDPVSREVMAYAKELYGKGAGIVNPVYSRMFGMNMPQVKNYAPTRFLNAKDSKDIGLDGSPTATGTTPSFAKSRVTHSAKIAPEDALTVMQGHIAQQAHWVHFAELAREFRAILSNPEVRESLKQTHGDGVLKSAELWADQLEQRGGNKARESAWLNNVIGTAISGKAVASLGFNLKTLAMQLDNTIRFGLALDTKQIVSALSNPSTIAEDIQTVWESDAIQNRLQGGATAEARFLFSRYAGKPNFAAKIAEASMTPINWLDSAGTSISSAIVYRANLNDALAAGMPENLAKQTALNAASEAIYRFAQPVSFGQKSIIENNGNVFAKTFFLFMSDPRLKTAILADAARGLATGRGNASEHIRRIVAVELMALVSHVISSAFKDTFSDDDDEEIWGIGGFAKAMLLAPFQGFFFAGSVAEVALSKLTGQGYFTSSQNPLLNTAESAIRAGSNLDDAFNLSDPEAMLKQWNNIFRSMAVTPTMAAFAVLLNMVKPVVGLYQNATTED